MSKVSFNPIGWQLDTLDPSASAIITSKNTSKVDLSGAQTVTSIKISGSQPPKTYRYLGFQIDDVWGRLDTDGSFKPFRQNNAVLENLAANGNTPAELSYLTDIPALAGKIFGIAIALVSEDSANAVPTIGISFTCKNTSQTLHKSQTSPVYELGDNAQIISITAEKETLAGGSVDIMANAVLHDGSSTGWLGLGSFEGLKAKSVQLRGDYHAQTLGTSQARIKSCTILYTDGTSILTGITSGDIITLTEDWYMPLRQCRVTLKHSELKDAFIKVYAALRASPKRTGIENLGIGTGGRKTYQLQYTDGIRYDSFRLFYDGVQVYSDFELNCEAGRVTCAAPSGVIVSCEYEHGWDFEDWRELSMTSRIDMDEYFKSEYRYMQDAGNNTVAAVKIAMGMTSGRTDNEVLGTAQGTAKSFRLARFVRDGRITITANNVPVAAKNWTLHEDNQHITIAASSGATLRASYDWISETPVIHQFSAVFAD